MWQKCAKVAWNVTFWTKKKVKQQDTDIKNSPLVEPADRKNTKEENKLLPN